MVEVGDFAIAARHDGHARRARRRPRRRLVAHGANGLRRRSDKDQAGGRHRFGETRILGKKSISGMDRAGPGLARGGNDRVDVEIALAGRRRTDADCLVGIAHGEAVLVGLAVHRDGAQIELLRRTDDAHGDFAAIGNQELVEHAGSSGGLDEQHRLSRLDRRLVVDEKAHHLAARVGVNLGELLHHLDQADRRRLPQPGRRPACRAAFPAPAADRKFRAADLTPDAAPSSHPLCELPANQDNPQPPF